MATATKKKPEKVKNEMMSNAKLEEWLVLHSKTLKDQEIEIKALTESLESINLRLDRVATRLGL